MHEPTAPPALESVDVLPLQLVLWGGQLDGNGAAIKRLAVRTCGCSAWIQPTSLIPMDVQIRMAAIDKELKSGSTPTNKS